jgi:hypothetical protein
MFPRLQAADGCFTYDVVERLRRKYWYRKEVILDATRFDEFVRGLPDGVWFMTRETLPAWTRIDSMIS